MTINFFILIGLVQTLVYDCLQTFPLCEGSRHPQIKDRITAAHYLVQHKYLHVPHAHVFDLLVSSYIMCKCNGTEFCLKLPINHNTHASGIPSHVGLPQQTSSLHRIPGHTPGETMIRPISGLMVKLPPKQHNKISGFHTAQEVRR